MGAMGLFGQLLIYIENAFEKKFKPPINFHFIHPRACIPTSRRKLTINTHFQLSIHIYFVNVNTTCFGPLKCPSSGVLQHRG